MVIVYAPRQVVVNVDWFRSGTNSTGPKVRFKTIVRKSINEIFPEAALAATEEF